MGMRFWYAFGHDLAAVFDSSPSIPCDHFMGELQKSIIQLNNGYFRYYEMIDLGGGEEMK